jgi:hypothetical protein
MIVCAIVVVMVGILTFAIIQIRSVFESADVEASLQADGRIAVNNIIADLRRTSGSQKNIVADTPVVGTDAIVFHLPLDADADGLADIVGDVLQWDPTDITIRLDTATSQLRKTISGNSYFAVLANNVKSIRCYDHALDSNLSLSELRVVLDLQKANKEGRVFNYTSTSIINMRNN